MSNALRITERFWHEKQRRATKRNRLFLPDRNPTADFANDKIKNPVVNKTPGDNNFTINENGK